MSISEINKINLTSVVSVEAEGIQSITTHQEEVSSKQSKQNNKAGQRRLRTETLDQHGIVNQIKLAGAQEEGVAKILLKYGGDPKTVIFRAAKVGDIDSVKKLIDFGFPTTYSEYENVTDFACHSSNLELLKYLVDDKKIAPKREDPFDGLIAQPRPFFEGIDFLISKGYQISKCKSLWYALFAVERSETFWRNKQEEVKALVDRGIDLSGLKKPETASYILSVLLGSAVHSTAPNFQLSLNNRELLKLFISYGLNVNVEIYPGINGFADYQSQKSYKNPLLIAIANHDIELVKLLVLGGADVNLSGEEIIHYTYGGQKSSLISPLSLAINYVNQDAVVFLLEHGAKP